MRGLRKVDNNIELLKIDHVHFHIIPRFENDNISFRQGTMKTEKEELEEYQKMIKKEL